MEEKKKTSGHISLQSVREARKFVRRLSVEPKEARERGQKIAWIMAHFPYPILDTFDVKSSSNENYATLCAATRVADKFLRKAESDGYSPTICGYIRNTLGYISTWEELGEIPEYAPDGGIPKPDMLLACSSLCDVRVKNYQAIARYWDIPMYGFDRIIPQRDADQEEMENCIKYNAEEYKGLIEFLEKQTGKKMDWDKYEELLDINLKVIRGWERIFELRKAVPSPMTTRDGVAACVPYLWRSTDPDSVDFYNNVYQEVKERVDKGIGANPNEKYRLNFLSGLPPWHTLEFFNSFDRRGAVGAIETPFFPHWWLPDETGRDPLERLSCRMTFEHWWVTVGMFFPGQWVKRMNDEWKVDGMVYHEVYSCRAVNIGTRACIDELKEYEEYKDMPALIIEADHIDILRDYSDPQIQGQIDSFIEAVDAYKRSKRR